MTVVYKQTAPGISTGQEVVIANDSRSKRLLFHTKVSTSAPKNCEMPLEIFIEHSAVDIRHDLSDSGISICAPSVLSFIHDTFDCATRDDLIRGLLMNEELVASSIYVAELTGEQYAAKVTNWQLYQIVR